MYIRTACRGEAPDPYAACGRMVCAATGRRKENVAQKEQMHHLHIELTPAQYQMLTEKAKRCRTTKRTFIIRLMEGKELRARPSEEIKALRTERKRFFRSDGVPPFGVVFLRPVAAQTIRPQAA